MKNTENKRLITKRDVLIICIVLAAGLLSAVIFKMNSQHGSRAVISVDGKTVKTISLQEQSGTYSTDEALSLIHI